ncbi:uncharacterized protein LOC144419822 [Styela clava]
MDIPSTGQRESLPNSTSYHGLIEENAKIINMNMQWIICQAVCIIIFIITMGVFCAMTSYGLRNRKLKCNSRDKSSILYVMVFSAGIETLLRLGAFEVMLSTVFMTLDDGICNAATVVHGIFYSINIMMVYVTLWLRQYLLYSRPNMKRLTPKWLRFLSYVCILLILIQNIYYMYVYATTVKMVSNGVECVQVLEDGEDKTLNTMFSISVFIGIASQALLLFLFIFPLLKHVQNRRRQSRVKLPPADDSHTVKLLPSSQAKNESGVAESSFSAQEVCNTAAPKDEIVEDKPTVSALQAELKSEKQINCSPSAKRLTVADVSIVGEYSVDEKTANSIKHPCQSLEIVHQKIDKEHENVKPKWEHTEAVTKLDDHEIERTENDPQIVSNPQNYESSIAPVEEKARTKSIGNNPIKHQDSVKPSPIIYVLKKSTVLATITVISDICTLAVFAVFVAMFDREYIGSYVYSCINEINAFVNNFAIFFILKDWKTVLSNCFCR